MGDILLIEGAFDDEQKHAVISKVTEAMVGAEGEARFGVTWVCVLEVAGGNWGISGKPLTPTDVPRGKDQWRTSKA